MPSTITDYWVQAYWYACGYNDHRQQETGRPQPYIDANEFAMHWEKICQAGGSRPSMQDAFKAFAAQVLAPARCDFVGDEGVSCDAAAPHCIGGETYYCDEHVPS